MVRAICLFGLFVLPVAPSGASWGGIFACSELVDDMETVRDFHNNFGAPALPIVGIEDYDSRFSHLFKRGAVAEK